MPRVTDEYVREEFLARFARMTPEQRSGTIEALTVIHKVVLAAGKPAPAAPLFEQSETEAKQQ
jgi:hypothetical protein